MAVQKAVQTLLRMWPIVEVPRTAWGRRWYLGRHHGAQPSGPMATAAQADKFFDFGNY